MPSFAELSATFLKEEFAESPVLASSLGLTEYDERLDDLSAEAFHRHEERSSAWLKRFRALPDDALTPAERIDRDFACSILRGREYALTDEELAFVLSVPSDRWVEQDGPLAERMTELGLLIPDDPADLMGRPKAETWPFQVLNVVFMFGALPFVTRGADGAA